MAKMENAKYGLCYASGLGATMGFLGAFEAGDHILYTDDLYGGTNRFFKKIASRFGITSTPVDATNIDLLEKAIQKNTKVSVYKLFQSSRVHIVVTYQDK